MIIFSSLSDKIVQLFLACVFSFIFTWIFSSAFLLQEITSIHYRVRLSNKICLRKRYYRLRQNFSIIVRSQWRSDNPRLVWLATTEGSGRFSVKGGSEALEHPSTRISHSKSPERGLKSEGGGAPSDYPVRPTWPDRPWVWLSQFWSACCYNRLISSPSWLATCQRFVENLQQAWWLNRLLTDAKKQLVLFLITVFLNPGRLQGRPGFEPKA